MPFAARSIRGRRGIFENTALADKIIEVVGAMLLECVMKAFHYSAGNVAVASHCLTSWNDEAAVDPKRVADDELAPVEQRKTTMLATLACLVVLAADYSGNGADWPGVLAQARAARHDTDEADAADRTIVAEMERQRMLARSPIVSDLEAVDAVAMAYQNARFTS